MSIMKLSKERIEEIKAQIRKLKVQQPNISARQIATVLKHDRTFIAKLKLKVDRENRHKIDHDTVRKELARLEELVHEGGIAMRGVMYNTANFDKEKVAAYSALVNAYKMLLDAKFDSGVFKKELGKIEASYKMSIEDRAEIKKVIEYAINQGAHKVGKFTIDLGDVKGDGESKQEKTDH